MHFRSSAGTRSYATAMAELLDPKGLYFGNRIIAQGVNVAPGEEPAADVQYKRLMQVNISFLAAVQSVAISMCFYTQGYAAMEVQCLHMVLDCLRVHPVRP